MSIDSYMVEAVVDPVVRSIKTFIECHDPDYQQWYVGGTHDLKERLFGFHEVDPQIDLFIVVGLRSPEAVESIERYFQTTDGCRTYECKKTKGGTPGRGLGVESTMAYAYRITENTRQEPPPKTTSSV